MEELWAMHIKAMDKRMNIVLILSAIFCSTIVYTYLVYLDAIDLLVIKQL